MRLSLSLLCAAISLAGFSASAHDDHGRHFPAERLEYGVDKEAIINTSWASVPQHLEWNAALVFGYSNDPLYTYEVTSLGNPTDRANALVENRLAGHLTGSIAFFEWLQLGAELPLLAFQQRDDARAPANDREPLGTFGIGDVRLYPKGRILRQRDGAPLDIGFQVPVTLPTGQFADFFGEQGFTFTPTILASREFDLLGGTVRVAGNLGARLRTEPAQHDDQNVLGTEFIARGGAAYVFYVAEDRPTELGLSVALAPQVDGFLRDIPSRSPAEVLGELDHTVWGPLGVLLGGAVGVQSGAGGPDYRVYAGLRFAPRAPADRDGDGIADRNDKCVDKPETKNGFEDDDGCPDVDDKDADGVRDADDACPDVPEDKDGFEDDDGCPDDDHDKDGIVNADDKKENAECVAISQEAKLNLKIAYVTQEVFRHERGRYGSLAEIGFTYKSDGAPSYKIDIVEATDVRFLARATGLGLQAGDEWVITQANDLVNNKSLCVLSCAEEAEDKDGFEDQDGCPDLDNDGDGVPDDKDGCPNDAEDKDGFEDQDGCPDRDNDKDGVDDAKDKCQNDAGVADNDGCPDPDSDNDGVADRLDNCPDEPGLPQNQGCKVKQLVRITKEKLEILDKVFFKTGKDVIESKSFALLDNVVAVLAKHKEIDHIRVEGHTDNVGDAQQNKDLSDRRAKAVVKYLVDKGVEAGRVVSEGFGQDRPVTSNDTDEGRAQNRRVEFAIVH